MPRHTLLGMHAFFLEAVFPSVLLTISQPLFTSTIDKTYSAKWHNPTYIMHTIRSWQQVKFLMNQCIVNFIPMTKLMKF